MSRLAKYLIAVVAGAFLAGCSGMLDGSNEISIRESQQPNPDAPKVKYAASIRVAGYTDERKVGDARKVGVAKVRVAGLSGTEIRLDRDVKEVVADSITKRLDDAGFQMLGRDDNAALFELSGVVRELSIDAKERDYVSISVETTLKELASGKVVWSGEVVQKSDRFAGVSGNDKEDIANYLHHELDVVSGKTTEAISATLMASRSDLFNLTPGTKAIPGVTVYSTPGIRTPVPNTPTPTMPAASNGQLSVSTEPARAKIYLDGVYYGLSPIHVEATPGIHTLQARLKGHATATEKVAVRKGETTELEMQLEK
ncbi:MAG: PEGA domain-containing protein [Nitrosomonadales bacterium]|nr:PEGA domain-containing protein [Nitrosomonadales bacterium]